MHTLVSRCQDNQNNRVEMSNRFYRLHRIQRSVNLNDFVSPTISSTFSNQIKIKDADTVTSTSYNQIVSDRSTYENNAIKRNITLSNVRSDLTELMKTLFFYFNKRPSLQHIQTQNFITTEAKINSDNGLIDRSQSRAKRLRRSSSEEQQNKEESEKRRQSMGKDGKQRRSEGNEETQRRSERKGEKRHSKDKTLRRNEKRGEKRMQNRRGHKRNCRRLSIFFLSVLTLIFSLIFLRNEL